MDFMKFSDLKNYSVYEFSYACNFKDPNTHKQWSENSLYLTVETFSDLFVKASIDKFIDDYPYYGPPFKMDYRLWNKIIIDMLEKNVINEIIINFKEQLDSWLEDSPEEDDFFWIISNPLNFMRKHELTRSDVYELSYSGNCKDLNNTNHWFENSLYLTDENFAILSKSIDKFIDNFPYFGPYKMSYNLWDKIITDNLEKNKNITKDIINFKRQFDLWLENSPENDGYFWILGY